MSIANHKAFPNDFAFEENTGLTKREYIAAMALQGLLANPGGPIQKNGNTGWGLTNATHAEVAGVACRAADALISALEKP